MSSNISVAEPMQVLNQRADLAQYGSNALLLFTLQLRFDIEDIHAVATNSITDGNNDKKCDLVYIDRDAGVAIIAQGYISANAFVDRTAPSNKASDLNTAVSWLLASEIENIPNLALRNAATDLRSALVAKEINRIEIWYSHNLTSSKNVADELTQVAKTATSILAQHYSSNVDIETLEIGRQELVEIYESIITPILVSDDLEVGVKSIYEIKQSDWSAVVTAIPASWLQQLYRRHDSKLFSANVRGYLGSRNSDANINNSIKKTAEEDPNHFWVFNNGVTAVTNRCAYDQSSGVLSLAGLSIVNGAQTTGALGSIESDLSEDVMVPARFIVCTNPNTILSVIQYNNSQNRVEAPDFRSNDGHQRRLVAEFKLIPDSEYLGGRRGGADDVIRRRPNLLSSTTVAQSLTAFHGDPLNAYNRKSSLWSSNTLYDKIFNSSTTARHIVFVYGLLQAILDIKTDLRDKEQSGTATQIESSMYNYFSHRGSIFLAMAAIGACIETLAGKQITNRFHLSFGNIAPDSAKRIWQDVLGPFTALLPNLISSLSGGLKGQQATEHGLEQYRTLVEATAQVNEPIYSILREHLEVSS